MLCVIGAGAMGTALAVQVSRAGRHVTILATEHDGAFVDAFMNDEPHPSIGVRFPPGCEVAGPEDWARHLEGVEIVVLAVSTAGLVPVVRDAAKHTPDGAIWAVATKGWDEQTLRSAAGVVGDEIGAHGRAVALVGPSLAAEIAAGVPTAVVAASSDPASAAAVARVFNSPLFRAYTTDDVAGVEVAAALKNVIAIAIGLCEGLAPSFGVEAVENTKAFVFSRGLVETARLARAVGGRTETVLGLSGAGDLFVTALGGRNARFGRLVGGGMTPDAALAEMKTTVEGHANAHVAMALAERNNVDAPVVRAVTRVLHHGMAPREAIEALIAGDVEPEFGA